MSVVAPRGDENRSVGNGANSANTSSGKAGAGKPGSRFPREARLLRHADFERVYKQGRRHFSSLMTVFYLSRTAPAAVKTPVVVAPGPRIGFTVGRALGGAVQRNRMKRRLREAVCLTRPVGGPDVDVVINPKKSLLIADFSAVVNEVTKAFVVIEGKSAKASGEEGRSPKAEARSRN